MLYALLFILWVGFGVLLMRKGALVARARQMSLAARKGLGLLLLVGSAAILVGGLFGLSSLANPAQGITLIGWVGIFLVGLLFVFCQTMAVAMLVTLGDRPVTPDQNETSTLSESAQSAGRFEDR